MASEKVEYVGFSVPGEELVYYFIYGEKNEDVLKHYTSLTGKPSLPLLGPLDCGYRLRLRQTMTKIQLHPLFKAWKTGHSLSVFTLIAFG